MNYKIKRLNKAYNKRFKQLGAGLLTSNSAGLVLFVEHLKYLRDSYTIAQPQAEGIITLNAAIEEFEAFKQNQKNFHWNNFWEFIKLNMEEWLAINDPV